MKNLILLICLILPIPIDIYAQVDFNKPVSFPLSPSAFSFLKYGEVPVNEYTGKANISIPLYVIEHDEVFIPLKLNYATGGIKVNQEASIVGLGWDFTLPSIVQIINDEDDYHIGTRHQKLPDYVGVPYNPVLGKPHSGTGIDYYVDHSYTPYEGAAGYSDLPFYWVASHDLLVYNGYYRTGLYYQSLYDQNSNVDSEPDIFSLQINGDEIIMTTKRGNSPTLSAYAPNLEIINGRNDYSAEILLEDNVENSNNSKIKGIKVLDPKGNIYYFTIQDIIESKFRSVGYLVQPSSYGYGPYETTSRIFKLEKIESYYNNVIYFTYEENIYTDIPYISSKYIRRNGPTVHLHEQADFFDGRSHTYNSDYTVSAYFHSDNINNFLHTTTITNTQKINSISKIITPKEIIEFTYSEREDFPGNVKLDLIKVKNKFNKEVKKFDFFYSYFESNDSYRRYGNENSNRYKKRLKLELLQENGKSPYKFSYDIENLPDKTAYAVDYWGFYNGHDNNSFIPSFHSLGYTQFTDNIDNDFQANLKYTKAGSLQEIKYPTGGITRIEYALNEFDNLFNDPLPTPVTTGNGLRISFIKSYSSEDAQPIVTQYNYTGGINISKRKMIGFFTEKILETTATSSTISVSNIKSTPIIEIRNKGFTSANPLGEGDYIGYNKVEIIKGSGQNGKVVKTFSNNSNITYGTFNGMSRSFERIYVRARDQIKNGSILSQEVFDNLGNPISKKTFTYKVKIHNNNHYGVRISGYKIWMRWTVHSASYEIFEFPYHLLSFYPIYSSTTLLTEENLTTYLSSGSSKLITTYFYDSKNRIEKEYFFNPVEGFSKKIETRTIYYENGTTNILRPKTIIKLKESAVINQKNSLYRSHNNYKVLDQVFDCNNGSTDFQDWQKCRTIKYDLYSSDGKILQYTINKSFPVSIIWAYNNEYIVAKMENLKYQDIPEEKINKIKELSDREESLTKENDLIEELNSLRLLFPDAMITTFTYNPLDGVSSITNPAGRIIYYNYQDNRLIHILDHEKNIISHFNYNFKKE